MDQRLGKCRDHMDRQTMGKFPNTERNTTEHGITLLLSPVGGREGSVTRHWRGMRNEWGEYETTVIDIPGLCSSAEPKAAQRVFCRTPSNATQSPRPR